MLTLAFDTSAAHCAAALLQGDRVLAERLEAMDKGQAERLIPMLGEMLTEVSLGWGDLDLLAVGTGPGNFTGVRISVAAARGLALGLGIPAIGVTRLQALAHGLPKPLVVAEDARRGQVFLQILDAAGAPARLAEASELAALGGLPATGSAAALTGGPVLAAAMPLARASALIAQNLHHAAQRTGRPLPRPAPFYLRGADAAPPADPPPRLLEAGS
jgi:tRNA threonylcarbamoyl adenosine modification protein YeaZ